MKQKPKIRREELQLLLIVFSPVLLGALFGFMFQGTFLAFALFFAVLLAPYVGLVYAKHYKDYIEMWNVLTTVIIKFFFIILLLIMALLATSALYVDELPAAVSIIIFTSGMLASFMLAKTILGWIKPGKRRRSR